MTWPKPLPTAPGQQSVWDFPRPATVEPSPQPLRAIFAGVPIASTDAGFRTLETSHPPSYYFPPGSVQMQHLRPSRRTSFCEWKGQAQYFDLVVGERRALQAAWCYPAPSAAFACLAGCLAFYAGPMDACYVGDQKVVPQPGSFYGGWITDAVVGPFKGVPGSEGW